MSRLLSALVLLALQGCAAQRAERMAYQDAFGTVLEPQWSSATFGDAPSEAQQPAPRRKRAEPKWCWPVTPVAVTSAYGPRPHPLLGTLKSHRGIDLQAAAGQLVVAASSGTVTRAGWNGGHGRQLELAHAGGRMTRYSHLSMLLVESGTRVQAGDPIGLAGATGQATGPHLHFELWENGEPIDPEEALALVPEGLDPDSHVAARAR